MFKLATLITALLASGSAAYTTIVSCSPYPQSQQSSSYLDIGGGVARWFQYSSTGSTCSGNDDWTTHCENSARAPQTACGLYGSYYVWSSAQMNCNAYNALRDTAISRFGVNDGYADGSCSVVAVSGSRYCLIASYSIHASGTAVLAPDGFTADPDQPSFYYNGRTELRRRGRASNATSANELSAAASPNTYPYVLATNSESAPSEWTLGYLGSCSSVSQSLFGTHHVYGEGR